METSDPADQRTPPREAAITLDKIGLACRCRVVGVRASGALRKRMLAMGMVPGAEVETLRVAPLGDPIEYRVKGYCLSLRRAEARLIEVVGEEE